MNKDTSEIFKAYAARLVTESTEMCSKCHKPCSECNCSECNCSKSKEENAEQQVPPSMGAAETNMGAPEEKREVEIGNQIVSSIKSGRPDLQTVLRLAYELIKMHQVAPEDCEVPMQPSEVGGTHREENAEESLLTNRTIDRKELEGLLSKLKSMGYEIWPSRGVSMPSHFSQSGHYTRHIKKDGKIIKDIRYSGDPTQYIICDPAGSRFKEENAEEKLDVKFPKKETKFKVKIKKGAASEKKDEK